MIVAERKPLEAILKMMAPYRRVLVVGCGTCVSVCLAGGAREVAVLGSQVRMARRRADNPVEVAEATVHRQCDREFLLPLAAQVEAAEAVFSMGCGAGVQLLAETFPQRRVFPLLDTKFMGVTLQPGWWAERCRGCGECVLDRTGGICPITRCSKGLLNGPCGGYRDGKCEVDPTVDCGWLMIFQRLKELDALESLREILGPKDWSLAAVGPPRRVLREDVRIYVEEGPV
ncbi:MAG: methylenetetrahydrofolate reductase C-terminal domain-containing protein [Armatimonadota bacterium]|nr:methylenetetrahydrofolate reductase C-terminal domain-containing protein [Armatimonadota bacterium]MDR7426604.1 methylenetetrahydrofolate reductase C-terminal domain-containing protein [Armatimonadota bacterium]MDR7468624.1 methylenetetrahydrofolate reductase C-terminal domain-containing protein [Armatimonadota bacterium]MDR7473747.1 methylenetetrahydrofolate reductase C-terminal domain-containing protein [Armatimonadota bacterium]MDR7538130.1 methylenetetrahydrofolate reductase C-terminal d